MADFIKLPRSALTDNLWHDGNAARLYLYLLAKGDEPVSFRGMAKETRLSVREIRTTLAKLQKAGLVTQVATQKTTQVATQVTLCGTRGKSTSPTQVATQKTTQVATQVKSTKFIPPTDDEIKAYALEKGYHFDPAQFVPFYQSKGWMVGKNPMKDWRAACQTWELEWQKKHGNQFYYQISNGTARPTTATNDYASRAESRRRMSALASEIVSRDADTILGLYNGQER